MKNVISTIKLTYFGVVAPDSDGWALDSDADLDDWDLADWNRTYH